MKYGPQRAALICLRGYQRAISPLLGPRCRFYPSCSEYALQSVERFGLLQGAGLAVWRLLRCHPFHPGGFDPVPSRHP
ncbi:MAG: membrane protein insertion efficiency factor YidD [Terriglobales bacterium]